MNIAKLMQQAQKLQQAQSDLSTKTAEHTDPSGKVTAVANGAGELQSLKIDPSILSTDDGEFCLLYTSPSPRDRTRSRMPSSA